MLWRMRHQQQLQAIRLDHPCHHACLCPSSKYFLEGGGAADEEVDDDDDEPIGPLVGCLR